MSATPTLFDTGPEMKITAIAPWFGSKRTLSPEIVRELGKHRVYWEPFCGSMAVLLAKSPCVMETANDLHGDLINLARVLQSESLAVELYGRLSRTLMHEDLYTEAAERARATKTIAATEAPNLDRAADYVLCAWLGRNGVAGTANNNLGFCVRFTANGGHAAKRFQSVAESIPAWHERLRNVTILNRDGFELLEKIADEPSSVIYCDPPYLVKGAKYVHDFRGEDHERLAKLLARFKETRVVVSYYDHPKLAELYAGWTVRHLKATKSLVSQGKRGQKGAAEAPECLLLNGPSYAEAT